MAGVLLEGGERIAAKWVFGADGRASTVAGRLGIEKSHPLSGEVAFLFAYWRGIPNDGFATSTIHSEEIVNRWAAGDDLCLLIAWGDAEFTRGSGEERTQRYLAQLRRASPTRSRRTLLRAPR